MEIPENYHRFVLFDSPKMGVIFHDPNIKPPECLLLFCHIPDLPSFGHSVRLEAISVPIGDPLPVVASEFLKSWKAPLRDYEKPLVSLNKAGY